MATVQPSPRVLASRRNGALGGKARAAKFSKEQRDEWSRKGGNTTSERYGPALKRFITTKRKTHGRYKKPAAECHVKGIIRKKPTSHRPTDEIENSN